jgi:hypothetical protein
METQTKTNPEKLHPLHNVYDGLFNSASGKVVNITSPRAKDICLYDIAKGQANNCRFGGQVNQYESVARHTLLVWFLAPAELKKVALLHDASEAYLGDVKKPLKVILDPLYGPIERHFNKLIFTKYHVDIALLPEIKPYDLRAAEIEHNYHRRVNNEYMLIMRQIEKMLSPGTPFQQLHHLLLKEFGQHDD